jgi:hypothetical protein
VQSNSSLPISFLRERTRNVGNRVIRHAKPNQVRVDGRKRDRYGASAHCFRQQAGLSPRRAAASEHDLVDGVPGLMQRRRQSRTQIPRSNNGDPRTTSHARQNSRSGKMQKSEVKMQK